MRFQKVHLVKCRLFGIPLKCVSSFAATTCKYCVDQCCHLCYIMTVARGSNPCWLRSMVLRWWSAIWSLRWVRCDRNPDRRKLKKTHCMAPVQMYRSQFAEEKAKQCLGNCLIYLPAFSQSTYQISWGLRA